MLLSPASQLQGSGRSPSAAFAVGRVATYLLLAALLLDLMLR